MSSQRDNGSEAGAGLREDPLFAALTRPSTVFGITVEVFAFIVTVEMALFMFTKNVTVFASGIALYGIARVMSAKDPRFFRYYLLALQTKWRGQTRRRWGGSSYSTLPTRKRSRP